jgi:hypothetical protein
MMDKSVAEQAEAILKAGTALSLEDLCRKVYGRVGSRERATMYVVMSRFMDGGKVRKNPATYQWIEKKMRRVSVKG